MTKKNEIEINGEAYIKKSEAKNNSDAWMNKNKENKTMCIVRTYSAGVFYGYIDYEGAGGTTIEVFDAVNIWKWEGAFTLLKLATDGTNKPSECKFSVSVPVVKLNRWIELLPMTEKAIESLNSVERG